MEEHREILAALFPTKAQKNTKRLTSRLYDLLVNLSAKLCFSYSLSADRQVCGKKNYLNCSGFTREGLSVPATIVLELIAME